ncbi:MAG: hypothetical protein AVDCRST_MAG69-1643 [uncultured Solirubrobacteraceae bacterium]|uniref:Uncharacterized protein n=1 Tax=uncultured Solirubrobacteraceae bacterium TaxID=1162706 RepID=A0A6J4SMV6_9ACTN|nr:MAG: hypothetical protein AVDCRST_MAG69-1643 [uncultured Solirubrobacteraceae bacterium]
MTGSSSKPSGTSLSLTTGGITLLGVLLSVGVTVAFGIKAEWWIRAIAGLSTTVGLIVVVKVTTAAGRGPLARVANWIIGSPGEW